MKSTKQSHTNTPPSTLHLFAPTHTPPSTPPPLPTHPLFQVKDNELGIEQYIITKALTKAPNDYPDAKNQPHVQVAKAMIEQGGNVAPGAVIEYVICVDSSKSSVADRAYHPKTVLKAEGMLQIDTAWYMAQQLHPPIWRLCDPIDGLDSSQVAECLGLDPSKFHSYASVDVGLARDELQLPGGSAELSKMSNATPLMIKCNSCGVTSPFRGLLGQGAPSTGSLGGEWVGGKALNCSNCSAPLPLVKVQNALTMAAREWIVKYYSAPLQCDEPSCKAISYGLSTHKAVDEAGMPLFPACTVPRCTGRMCKTITDKALHTQLLSYKCLFDVQWAHKKLEQDNKRRSEKVLPSAMSPEESRAFDSLMQQADRALKLSAYNTIDMRSLLTLPTASEQVKSVGSID